MRNRLVSKAGRIYLNYIPKNVRGRLITSDGQVGQWQAERDAGNGFRENKSALRNKPYYL